MPSEKEQRRERLAMALRSNIVRRKEQARGREKMPEPQQAHDQGSEPCQ
ncbi:MAG: hypothetical protein M3O22_07840 [Pseudomonadota bacterium]|nr:hypothetical protein [Pseudomonadota bacterium]